MGIVASQITSLTIVYAIVSSCADQRKEQSSTSLAFVRGIYQWHVISSHKGPVTPKMFPFDDFTMEYSGTSMILLLVPGYIRKYLTFVPNNSKQHVSSQWTVNSLWPIDVIWRQGTRTTLAQVMACCLMAPSHYLNQCWPMISEVMWHSPDSDFIENTCNFHHWNEFEIY